MKRLLITGADGFVGRWLVRAARADGWTVVAAVTPGAAAPGDWLTADEAAGVETVIGDLRESATIAALVARPVEAVVHLAAIASGPSARRDPTLAWAVNAGVTAVLADALAGAGQPRFLLVSTGEVYGRDHTGPIPESAPLAPVSAYAASKVGAEVAAGEVARRTGLPMLIARPFPHTGPGQSEQYVFPALAARLRRAARDGHEEVTVGNLAPIRDLLDVRDVVTAYLGIVARGVPGEAYNVASGEGLSLAEAFGRLAALAGSRARPVVDPSLLRPADVPVLIGDATKLRSATGWVPVMTRDRTFQDLVHAQAD